PHHAGAHADAGPDGVVQANLRRLHLIRAHVGMLAADFALEVGGPDGPGADAVGHAHVPALALGRDRTVGDAAVLVGVGATDGEAGIAQLSADRVGAVVVRARRAAEVVGQLCRAPAAGDRHAEAVEVLHVVQADREAVVVLGLGVGLDREV